MVNPAVFNSNFGEWKNRTKKDRYMILPQDLTLLKLVNFEDFVVMDVIDSIDFGKKVDFNVQESLEKLVV